LPKKHKGSHRVPAPLPHLPPTTTNFDKKTQGEPWQAPTFFLLQQALQKNTQGGGHPAPPLPPIEANAAQKITRGGIVAPPPLPLAAASPALQSKREGGTHTSLL